MRTCPFSRHKAYVVYRQCYLPMVGYPLPATSMPPERLYKLQSPATAIFLTKIGYPCTFPRAIVYAPPDCGGIGFLHLGHEQGLQKCLQLIKHLRTNTGIGEVYRIVLQHYQLLSGFPTSILEDTRTIPWSNAPWIDTVRRFLHLINGQILLPQPWLPKACRQHDRFLMSDILELNLPATHAFQVSSIHLYLQITTLSEITHHSGNYILPGYLHPRRPTPLSSTYDNYSTLQWPAQPCPSAAAWKRWRDILSVLYLQPQSTSLSQPLGLWTLDHATNYHWGWSVCLTTWTLFCYYKGRWITYSQRRRYPDYYLYQHHSSPSAKPTNTVPVTPNITSTAIKLLLPVTGAVPTQQILLPPVPLATRLLTPLHDWADLLWHSIHPHAHTDMLQSALLANLQIILVSDVAVHPDGTGTCAWIIWAGTEVWSGEGYAPSLLQDMYSGLVEAYGIYTVLSFFLQYTSYYPLIHCRRHPIHVYCDNKGLIDRIGNRAAIQYPRDAIHDDYPIYAEIDYCIQQLKPTAMRFIHVLGHQDTKSNKPLTLPEKLNIDCDARAANLPPPENPSQLYQNPRTDASYPHLRIHRQIIIRRLQATLRDAATQGEYFHYLQGKCQWATPPSATIHWHVLQLAL